MSRQRETVQGHRPRKEELIKDEKQNGKRQDGKEAAVRLCNEP